MNSEELKRRTKQFALQVIEAEIPEDLKKT